MDGCPKFYTNAAMFRVLEGGEGFNCRDSGRELSAKIRQRKRKENHDLT
jgi:hypothetical protein